MVGRMKVIPLDFGPGKSDRPSADPALRRIVIEFSNGASQPDMCQTSWGRRRSATTRMGFDMFEDRRGIAGERIAFGVLWLCGLTPIGCSLKTTYGWVSSL